LRLGCLGHYGSLQPVFIICWIAGERLPKGSRAVLNQTWYCVPLTTAFDLQPECEVRRSAGFIDFLLKKDKSKKETALV
jgi:hypothetical protein